MTQMYRVRASSTGWTGGPGLNTFYFQNTDPSVSDSTSAQACVDRVRAGFEANKILWPSQHNIQVSGSVDVLIPETGLLSTTYSVTTPVVVTGSNGTAYGPIAAAICVTMTTDTIIDGKRVRGRAFFNPLIVCNDSDGTPQVLRLTNAESIVTTIRGTGTPNPHLVVWHRPKNGAGGAAVPVVSAAARDTFAVLRSRRD